MEDGFDRLKSYRGASIIMSRLRRGRRGERGEKEGEGG